MIARWLYPTAQRLTTGVYLLPGGGKQAFYSFGAVFLGSGLLRLLKPLELSALIMHELGHRHHWVLRGLVRLLAPWWLPSLVRYQEFAADRYAQEQGFGPHLAEALRKLDQGNVGNYPATQERIRRLTT